MPDNDTSTPADIHTLDTLCNELVSGRTVTLEGGGIRLSFPSKESRSLFNWYRNNKSKWTGNVQKVDVEAMVDQMSEEPPDLPSVTGRSAGSQGRVLHLHTMRAHRFGGIHQFGSTTEPPEDFAFQFSAPLTLIQGANGAGKTSILNAVTWCLTGFIYRPQRAPESAEQAVPLGVEADQDNSEDSSPDMTPVTPMPPATVLEMLGNKAVPLDTWVELTFVDTEGTPVATVRRSLSRTSRGKIQVEPPDLSLLGLAPIAIEVGTRMPALIPYIRLGTTCDIGKAVSTMTGIRPLEDLVKHAERVQAKLTRDMVNDREGEIKGFDDDFSRTRDELLTLVTLHPELALQEPIPTPTASRGIETVLATNLAHFEKLQTQILSNSRQVLGDTFNPDDVASRKNLVDSIGPAIGLVEAAQIGKLSSAARLGALGTLGEPELTKAEELLAKCHEQAQELTELEAKPDIASRLRLYARVANWLKDLPQVPQDILDCPVCHASLESKIDVVTGQTVAEHLSHYLQTDAAFLGRTLKEWESNAHAELARDLPETLKGEMNKDLPTMPAALITEALATELFQARCFQSSLQPLRAAVKRLCEKILPGLPKFHEPKKETLPGDSCGSVSKANLNVVMHRITRAIAFARWRRAASDACWQAFLRIVGKPPETGVSVGTLTEDSTLYERLAALNNTVQSAEPLTNALAELSAMVTTLGKRRQKEERIVSYETAAKAIEPLFQLRVLVEKQVASLVGSLSSDMLKWKTALYAPAFVGAPRTAGADVASDGSLIVQAVAAGTTAPAGHVSNASDLRATLLAFLLAFWEYLIRGKGGLSLLLLDDLQELFDEHNRRKLANSIPLMVRAGGRLVVTTNDIDFGRLVLVAMNRADSSDTVDHRQVHPLNPCRDHIELVHFAEEIDRKRAEFEKPENVNVHQPARDYVKDLRIYLEERMLDLFEIPVAGLSKQPTLSDLLGGIRKRRNDGHEAFTGLMFRELLEDEALAQGSDFLGVMNDCHHARESKIMFSHVYAIRDDCLRVRKRVDSVHEEHGRWMRREPVESPGRIPDSPAHLTFPHMEVVIVQDLAAFTTDNALAAPSEGEERLTHELLTNHSTYALNTHNLGFAVTPNCRVLVNTARHNVPDNSLVIALHGSRTYARRLLRSSAVLGTLALGSDSQNPLKRAPSIFLPASEVRLLQIVGILFCDRPIYPKTREEAVPVDATDLIAKVRLAFKVRGNSAIPLALPEQIVLGGESLTPSQISHLEGRLVAVGTTDGNGAFKRIGRALPGLPHVRLFESVGGLGESMLVRVEEKEDDFSDIPLMQCAREILGVLYTTAGTL